MSTAKEGDLKVWWVPQLSGETFECHVESVDQAIFLMDTLARYDAFQFENRIKPDYCNAGGLSVYEGGDWVDWCNDDGDDIDDEIERRRQCGELPACDLPRPVNEGNC